MQNQISFMSARVSTIEDQGRVKIFLCLEFQRVFWSFFLSSVGGIRQWQIHSVRDSEVTGCSGEKMCEMDSRLMEPTAMTAPVEEPFAKTSKGL